MDRIAEIERFMAQLEEENTEACRNIAYNNRFSIEQADACDNGELNCLECPWQDTEKDDNKCPQCGGTIYYSFYESTDCPIDGYDAHYCDTCNIWLTPNCSDPECEFCKSRPEKPLDLLNKNNY